jgi:4-diphosphocytidyl-2-C-methyl-D-erythritol kinase
VPYIETAYAKVNLALHVLGRRADGYHDLDTIFAFVDTGDILSANKAEKLSLKITGPFADNLDAGESNLVMRTARLLQEHVGHVGGANIILHKNLPVASGIGGGSADAAAAARLLARIWEIPDSDFSGLLAPLGADIPACVASKTARGTGTGAQIELLDTSALEGISTLLVNPGMRLSTANVFSAWDGTSSGALAGQNPLKMAQEGQNDLQACASTLCPQIGSVLAALGATRPLLARMSGSGATCFALYDNDRNMLDAESQIKRMFPVYWTMTGRLR